jgi:hypothetical protein
MTQIAVRTGLSTETDQTVYGTKIIPRLATKTATQKMTISAGTICKSFIATPYQNSGSCK